jgi:regulator of sigma E protease
MPGILLLENIFAFIVIISIIVVVHEFGHYYIAKKCGVKITEFSIGFGKELFGWNDKSGTRWKVCSLPFGGFVKMFGDESAASTPDRKKLKAISEKDKQQTFYFKNVYQRLAIILAGPFANFLLAIIIFAALARVNGISNFSTKIDRIIPNSVAERAGIMLGDIIQDIDGEFMDNFEEVKTTTSLSAGNEIIFGIERNGEYIQIKVIPEIKTTKDIFGNEIHVGMVGISSGTLEYIEVNTLQAINHSIVLTYDICKNTLKALGQIIIGQRSTKDLGGPLKIAQYSGQSLSQGFGMFVWFIALISANIGLMNLLPIPMLDGGHLFFYTIEVVRRKPVSEKIQDFAFKIGFAFIIGLMIFATLNDVINFIK